MKPAHRTLLVWTLLLALLAGASIALFPDDAPPLRPYDTFAAAVVAGDIEHVEVRRDDLWVFPFEGETYRVSGLAQPEILDWLQSTGMPVTLAEESDSSALLLGLGLVALALIVLALRRFQAGQANANTQSIFALRTMRARQLAPGAEPTRFTDVGGHGALQEQLGDVVDFLRAPERWAAAGARLPRGVLLEGPPGGGKTLLARAVAGEAGVPFFVLSASEFVEMFVGVGAARVRDLFAQAEKAAPCVVFIDELDAVGRRRGSGLGAGHDEREQTLKQLLTCLDGFTPTSRVVVIAATNRSDVLDRALLRPGRFDLRLRLDPPDSAARAAILAIHTRGKPLDPAVHLAELAEAAVGCSGAQLEHLCNAAAMRAVRRAARGGEVRITQDDLQTALQSLREGERRFDALDALLVESTSQLTQADAEIFARLTLAEGVVVEGRLRWADAHFIKIEPAEGGARLVPKAQLRLAEALTGTAAAGELRPDRWASRQTGTA